LLASSILATHPYAIEYSKEGKMKVNKTVMDELSDAIVEGMKRLGDVKAEAQSQIRSVLETAFQNLDIVTREQMEVQEALLTKIRKQISELEERIKALEAQS